MSSLPTTTACPQKYQSPILPREPVPKKSATSPRTSPRTSPSGSGTGPQRAVESEHPTPRAQRESSSSFRRISANAGPTREAPTHDPTSASPEKHRQPPRPTTSRAQFPSTHNGPSGSGTGITPDITQRQRDRAGASTGSDHPLPFAHSAKSPYLPRASLRAQDRSRGARPRARPRPCPHQFPNPQNQNKHLRHQLPCVTKYI
jgi:hypothetical protein